MGTGLGLFICMSLCRRLEGFIACSSTSGEGTVFHVGIPVEVQKDDSDTASQDSQEKMSTEEIVILGPIMIVDGNVLNIKILERQLLMQFKRIGIDIEIIRAGGGREAIALYTKRFPSLLIVDYLMPGIDGLETMSTIRRIETERGLRPSYIISYTADATDNAAMLLLGLEETRSCSSRHQRTLFRTWFNGSASGQQLKYYFASLECKRPLMPCS